MEATLANGPGRRPVVVWGSVLGGLLGMVAILSLTVGPVQTSPGEVLRAVAGGLIPGEERNPASARIALVVWEIRMPRLVVALLVGSALGTAGACLQGLFRNPLADPGLIGVSSGGAVGALLAISTAGWLVQWAGEWIQFLHLPFWSMAGALAATWVVYRIARIAGRTHVSTLLLAGIAVNALAGSLVGAVLYLSDNDALRRFTFWTLGSLHTATWKNVLVMAPFILVPLLILPRYRGALNAFLLGEAEAYHLGFHTQRLKRWIIGWCALMVGVTVAYCGLIGFVGLVVPHLVRLATGPDYRLLLPGSALLGAVLLLAADLLARTVNAPGELPIGVLTSLIGGPFFLYLIDRRKRQLET